MKLKNIILPSPPSTSSQHGASTYDIEISDHIIKSITPHSHAHSDSHDTHSQSSSSCPPPSLILPTLCHPHIHLDKPYLLTSNYNSPAAYPACCPPPPLGPPPSLEQPPRPSEGSASSHVSKDASTGSGEQTLPDYGKLVPKSGSFTEALQLTSKAKQLYTADDLYLRGKQLLATGYAQGVTCARCFVEVDHVTGEGCVEVGVRLKREFEGVRMEGGERGQGVNESSTQGREANGGDIGVRLMRVQLCAFAQDPIFSTEHGDENRKLLQRVLEKYAGREDDVEVLGTTPYVETSREASIMNIDWAIRTAMKYALHLDFHLDYNLNIEPGREGTLMVWEVLRLLEECGWPTRTKGKGKVKTVVLGHCSALTLLPYSGPYSLTSLATKIRESRLPVYFVGLPTSDLYTMGRPHERQETPLHRPRGTLNVLSLVKDYGLKACVGVNNVGNAFTPYGSGDPLEAASWGVGVYQGGGEGDAEKLYHAVSKGGREAIGVEEDGEDTEDEGAEGYYEDGKGDGDGWKGEFEVTEGMDVGDFGLLLVRNEEYINDTAGALEAIGMNVPARRRVSVRDVVWDVPEVRLRSVVW